MKSTILVSGMLLCTAASFGQDIAPSEVPSVILNAFQQEYRDVRDVEWEKKGDQYNVEFDINRADHEIWYDSTGKAVKHESEIGQSDLPPAVTAAIKRDFAKHRVSDIKKIRTGDSTVYRMELDNGPDEWDVTFAEDGKVVNKVAD